MLFRLTSVTALLSMALFGQSAPSGADASQPDASSTARSESSDATTAPPSSEIKPDLADPGVVRAQLSLDRIRALVRQGALPMNNLNRAQDELQDALDTSILRYSAYTRDLTPDQAEQMVSVAERMLLRRQKRVIQAQLLADSGVISRAEAQASGGDVVTAKMELDLATERAHLVQEIAESIRMQKVLAEAENDAESHPELNGQLYTRYDGNGIFTRADFDKISAAFLAVFGHPIPVSADGQTAVHRAMGFNHAGRIDIALSPDQTEGAWLIRYLERNHIPFFAFRSAVAHRATGAHIHLGPGSTRLVASLH